MADLSDLDLVNEHGDTKSEYTLIKNHATAIERVNRKLVYWVADADDNTRQAANGGEYFVDVSTNSALLQLPISSENVGMCVFAKVEADGESLSLDIDDTDTINGGSTGVGIELATTGDYAEIVATEENGWVAKYLLIQP